MEISDAALHKTKRTKKKRRKNWNRNEKPRKKGIKCECFERSPFGPLAHRLLYEAAACVRTAQLLIIAFFRSHFIYFLCLFFVSIKERKKKRRRSEPTTIGHILFPFERNRFSFFFSSFYGYFVFSPAFAIPDLHVNAK